MDDRAIINNQEYRLLELVPRVDDLEVMVLCENTQGDKYICSEKIWYSNVISDECCQLVNRNSSAQEKIEFFLTMFRGREELYAKRYYSLKSGKSGYAPACTNEWIEGVCDKKKYKCAECPHRSFQPLSAEIIRKHLRGQDEYGRDVVAVYPMREDNTTYFLAIDFDEKNWKEDVKAFCMCSKEVGLEPAVERSRSGNGAHVWFFFAQPVLATDARRLGSGLLTKAMRYRHELSFASYDRLFPTQDTLPKGGFGNLIALPFQGQAQKEGNTLFIDENYKPYLDQWAFLSALKKITVEQLEECIRKVCYGGDIGDLADFVDIEEGKESAIRKKWKKKLTNADFPIQTKLVMSNMLYLEKYGFSQAALNAIKRLAAFQNPEFRAKQAMRLPVYNIPRIIDCGYENEEYIVLPRGCREALIELLEQYGVSVIYEDKRITGDTIDVSFVGTLREEQFPAAEVLLKEDIGVLSATTAFGKTVIGAYLIGYRKKRTLILVQSSALLEQWKSSLEKFLEIKEVLPEVPKKRGRKKIPQVIGQIGAGKNSRSGIVDIAIMQSLFEGKEKAVKAFVEEYGMVIVDECHHVAAFTFESILKVLKARYVYGLSATPTRKDGHHPIIFMQCGAIRYLVDAKSQAQKRTFSHFAIPKFTRTRAANVSTIHDAYAAIIGNDIRNRSLIEDTLRLVEEERTPLLLTERKEHAASLAAMLEGKVQNVFLLLGSDKPKDKREKFGKLYTVPNNENVVVIATGKYIGEGFDWPRLDTLILAMPISWEGTLAQYAGRLHRNYEGKHEVRIYDYADIYIPMLERMYHKRIKGYTELGYQVKFGEKAEVVSQILRGTEVRAIFEQDMTEAVKSVYIASPYIDGSKIHKLLPLFQKMIVAGVEVKICGRAKEGSNKQRMDEMVSMLKDIGIKVELRDGQQQKFAVIDESVVWYGNVDLLGVIGKDTEMIRFDSADIAGELIEIFAGTGEQLVLKD